MKKPVIFAVLTAALVGGGWWGVQTGKFGSKDNGELAERFVARAEKRDIDFSVEVSGDVAPAFQLEVKSEVSGKLKALHVEPGDQVKEGDLLAEIDDRDLLTEKQSVLTEIDGARLEVDKDRRNFERAKELSEAKLISREQFDNLTSEFDMAQNALVRAQRKLDIVEDKLRKTKVISPMEGTVLKRDVIEGQVVIAAASVNSGTLLMTVANLQKLLVQTHVNQVDVARLKSDQEVKLRADSLKDASMTGTITRIDLVASVKNNIKGFAVEATIANPNPRLRPGMSVNLTVPIDHADDALSVPISAVFKGEGNQKVVYVRTGDATERREVKVGVTNFDYAEIKSGLQEGESILLVEPDRPGGPVTSPAGKGIGASRKRSS
ncbi:MAG TPA: efflux RND transporter periplasmic adaptor subunit [Chthoniobacteraceae bacterium]|nr:efflux RND transporter periplasmic adaptor subunit [Chthoniobacteraceae bacterium]